MVVSFRVASNPEPSCVVYTSRLPRTNLVESRGTIGEHAMRCPWREMMVLCRRRAVAELNAVRRRVCTDQTVLEGGGQERHAHQRRDGGREEEQLSLSYHPKLSAHFII